MKYAIIISSYVGKRKEVKDKIRVLPSFTPKSAQTFTFSAESDERREPEIRKEPEGKHCGEKNFLELDHIHPWGLGGDSTAENLRLLCRTHNQWRSEKTFGLQY